MSFFNDESLKWFKTTPSLISLFIITVPGMYNFFKTIHRYKRRERASHESTFNSIPSSSYNNHLREDDSDYNESSEHDPLLFRKNGDNLCADSKTNCQVQFNIKKIYLTLNVLISILLVYCLTLNMMDAPNYHIHAIIANLFMLISWFIFVLMSSAMVFKYGDFVYSSEKRKLIGWKRLFLFIALLTQATNWYVFKSQIDIYPGVSYSLVAFVLSTILLISEYQVLTVNCFSENGKRGKSPEKYASFLSRLSFAWFNPMIRLGTSKVLDDADLWDILDTDHSDEVNHNFRLVRNLSRPLWFKLIYMIRKNLIWQFSFALFSACFAFAGPFFLNRILYYIGSPDYPRSMAWIYLVGLFICSLVKSASDGQLYFTGRRNGLHVRSILVNEIYRKSLRRIQSSASTDNSGSEANPDQQSNATIGKIVTLMSVDTERIREYVSYCHIIIWTPTQIIIAVSSLVYVLGYPALAGVFIMLCTIPATTALGKWTSKVQEKLMETTDNRVTVMNEVLNGIRIIKYFAWEPQFVTKILDARNKELRTLIRYYITEAASGLVWHTAPLLVAFATFFTYTKVAGNSLDATTAFTGLALLNSLRDPLISFPHELLELFKALVSLERIEKFLQEDELERYRDNPTELEHETPAQEDFEDEFLYSPVHSESSLLNYSAMSSSMIKQVKPPIVGFRQASFTYFNSPTVSSNNLLENALNKASSITSLLAGNNFTLKDLNIEFSLNALTVVCGATGAGKSSLILALLGEMNRLSGEGYLPQPSCTVQKNSLYQHDHHLTPTVAYVAQSAWLMNATVRDNILFGEKYDPIRYKNVIRACALERDFETLGGGDLTEIGEKGINLSGGQKQRISLARAVYSRASFVLLDDPLSAVDAPTARHLFEKCITGLMANRTRILVTHAIGLVLSHATHIILMKSGELLVQGTIDEVMKHEQAESLIGSETTKSLLDSPVAERKHTRGETEDPNISSVSEQSNVDKGRLVEVETKQSGAVRFDVYLSYLKAAGGILFTITFFMSVSIAFGMQVLDDWWLKEWSDASSKAVPSFMATTASLYKDLIFRFGIGLRYYWKIAFYFGNRESDTFTSLEGKYPSEDSDRQTTFYLSIYALIGVICIIMDNINFFIQVSGSYRASKSFHFKLLHRVMNAPLRFFEVTPIGRIMNRFSKDIGCIDSDVMILMAAFVRTVVRGIVVLLVISFITPPFLLIAAPVSLLYIWVARNYLAVSREFKRLDSISKSPIYSLFSESLVGVSTIRAYGAETRFLKICAERLDKNHRSFFWLWVSNRWLAVRIDFIAAFVVFCAGSALLLGNLPAGLAGLSLTYALQFTEALLWTVRLHAQMEMNMNSVERVNEYLEIAQESSTIVDKCKPDSDWPSEGAIIVKNLSIRYSQKSPCVLNNVSFSCPKHTKIGIVGRTGAGKSTLSLAFFRILPIHEGSIEIDRINISKIGLRDLRSGLTIIPQDPVLFTGTLRSNLDPFDEHDDLLLWSALKRVHFLESLQLSSVTLENEVNESNDENASDDNNANTNSVKNKNSSDAAINSMSLDAPVSENGNNFSQGQRQLLCMARALLRKSKVVILDEATASVDNETDMRIQKVIREAFQEATVLTIAHRLRTVMDYDRILVLDKGKVVEYDQPLVLAQKEGGHFNKMCQETGEFNELIQLASKN